MKYTLCVIALLSVGYFSPSILSTNRKAMSLKTTLSQISKIKSYWKSEAFEAITIEIWSPALRRTNKVLL